MHLVVILVIAFIGSIVFSGPWIITPKYKSWAVVYPANISPYSEESETEQMFQVLKASYVRDQVIEKFNLGKHYDISKDGKHYKTYLFLEYNENVSISKTPGEAIRIEVLDEDPEIAKQMVEAILFAYNQKIKMLHNDKFREVVEMWGRAIDRKKQTIDSLEMQLNKLAVEDGLLNYESQSTELIKGILGTVEGGSTRINKKEVEALTASIKEKGGLLLTTLNNIEYEGVILGELTKEYDIAYSNLDRQYSHTNEIESPYVSDKKASPVRWLIVVLTLFATFFFAVVFIGILENLRIRKAQK